MSRFEIKIVAALLLIAVIPLAASIYLVGQVIKVSDSVTEGQTERLAEPLERAAAAYRGLFAARKEVFRLRGHLMSQDPRLRQLLAGEPLDAQAIKQRLARLMKQGEGIGRMRLLGSEGQTIAEVDRRKRFDAGTYRDLAQSIPTAGVGKLELHFYTPRQPFEDFRSLGRAQQSSVALNELRDELARYYRIVFLIMFGTVAMMATGLGVFIARRTTRRVALLAQATRKVARGDLETRVDLGSRDELGYLADSFNKMVRRLKESAERIGYLEKVGAWQEIARRLAHEIKNPLTPIQLAAQQLLRKYSGEDEAFARTLEDAHDIITEEVDGLRRLVQAFSSFAKLPQVNPEPVELGLLVDDFLKSHVEQFPAAEVVWEPEPELAGCRVLVDRQLIKHVLFNLVENAAQAAEEAGQPAVRVEISASFDPVAPRVALSVADDGPGMEMQTVRRIFDPYFTTKESGTGLGLAIVKKIVLEHRGSMVVSSAPGKGSRFVLTLPLERGDQTQTG